MPSTIREFHGQRVLVLPAEGQPLGGPADVLDLVGDAISARADWVAIPAGRLDADFFRLATGIAGEFVQKFVNYGIHLAIHGDVSPHVAASRPLRDFVLESNRRGPIWFVADLAELDRRLSAA